MLADLARKVIPVATLVALGWLGETGHDGGFIKDIWLSLKTASPPVAMILFVLLIDERRDRREAQKQTNERTIDFVQSTNGMSNAVSRMADGVSSGRTSRRRRLSARRR